MEIMLPELDSVTIDDIPIRGQDSDWLYCFCTCTCCGAERSYPGFNRTDDETIDAFREWQMFAEMYYCPQCTGLIEHVLAVVDQVIEMQSEQAFN